MQTFSDFVRTPVAKSSEIGHHEILNLQIVCSVSYAHKIHGYKPNAKRWLRRKNAASNPTPNGSRWLFTGILRIHNAPLFDGGTILWFLMFKNNGSIKTWTFVFFLVHFYQESSHGHALKKIFASVIVICYHGHVASFNVPRFPPTKKRWWDSIINSQLSITVESFKTLKFTVHTFSTYWNIWV